MLMCSDYTLYDLKIIAKTGDKIVVKKDVFREYISSDNRVLTIKKITFDSVIGDIFYVVEVDGRVFCLSDYEFDLL